MPVSVRRDEKRITWQEMVDKYPDMTTEGVFNGITGSSVVISVD